MYRFKFNPVIGLLILFWLFNISELKKNRTNNDDQDQNQEEGTPRNRNYKGKDRFGPIIGHGPFKIDQGEVADRSYDVGYILGQGYGVKLSQGIKKGIKNSLKPDFFRKKKDRDKDDEQNDEKD